MDIEDGSENITEDQSNNSSVDVGQSNATSVAVELNEQISSEMLSRLIDVQTTDAAYTSVPVDVDDVSKNLATDQSILASDSCYTVSGVDSGKA